jgi:hypothetical protein
LDYIVRLKDGTSSPSLDPEPLFVESKRNLTKRAIACSDRSQIPEDPRIAACLVYLADIGI